MELPAGCVGLLADHVELPVDNVHLPVADDDDIELSEFLIGLDLPELLKVYEKLRSTGIELYDTKEELRKANEKIISLEEQFTGSLRTRSIKEDGLYEEVEDTRYSTKLVVLSLILLLTAFQSQSLKREH